jgi:predicted metalloprotease with PDZ domain
MNSDIEYLIRLTAPHTQMVEIQMVIRNVSNAALDVALPVWRPGRYEVLDPAGTLRNVRASTADGPRLPIVKLDKTTWRIQTQGRAEIHIAYEIYASVLGNRTRHVDDTHAFLSGATVFFYVPDRRNETHLVRIEAPDGWKVATGLEEVEGNPFVRLASGYDVLADSPFEIGLHDVIPFHVQGKLHEIVLWGNARYDATRLTNDLTKIIESEAAIFGDMPYSRYVFLTHVSPDARGGTEHLNSTIMQTTPRAFEDEGAYKSFLGLVSHEMFHTWNVKQLRPAALNPYQYAKESYTDLLWLAEGTTSYYDDLILVRCGFESPNAYLAMLSESIDTLRRRPGARVQSVAESSFDAWIKFNRPNPDDVNSTVSFYTAGALVSLLLDMSLRTITSNAVSLDDVLREMYRGFPLSGPGYTTEDLIDILNRLSKNSFDEFFVRHVSGTEIYPFEEVLSVVGLELEFVTEGNSVRPSGNSKRYTGLNLEDDGHRVTVKSVISDGPAYSAGVNALDEVVALNGRRLSAAEIQRHVAAQGPGETVQLSVIRRGQLRTIDFVLWEKPHGSWQIRRTANPTESQKAAYASWLQRPW